MLKAITGTIEQVQERYLELENKIARDENKIELVQFIYHENSELVTMIWQPKQKKIQKTVTRTELNKKANIYGWDVIRDNEQYAIEFKNGNIMATAKTIKGIQRKLTQLEGEWLCACVDYRQTEFLQNHNCIK